MKLSLRPICDSAVRSLPGGGVDNPLSVGDLALQTREVIESRLRPVWVRGEISDFKRHRNGHWYFCLRDRAAQIRCVVWARDQTASRRNPTMECRSCSTGR